MNSQWQLQQRGGEGAAWSPKAFLPPQVPGFSPESDPQGSIFHPVSQRRTRPFSNMFLIHSSLFLKLEETKEKGSFLMS